MDGDRRAELGDNGRPCAVRPPVEYEPVPTVCPVCGTDLNITQSCPLNCLTREEPNR